ncbi:MAG TPA: hypothetical protein VN428_10480 [Bryobacteraceae bacterium]|nr:hypothetical protein [Bryobacteraceae bacterium]
MYRLAGLAAAVLFALTSTASAQSNSFEGTWKLNLAKSRYSPGPGPKAQTIIIEQTGKTTVNTIDREGEKMTMSFTTVPGQVTTIEGAQGATVLEKRIDQRTVEHVWKFGDMTIQGRGVLAKDGKSFVYTSTGIDRKGKKIKDYEVYERQ